MNRIFVVPLVFLTSLASADEFYADRNGGGPEDIQVQQATGKVYKAQAKRDIVFPDAQGRYKIEAREPGVVNAPYKVSKVIKAKRNSIGTELLTEVPANLTDDGELQIEAGNWTIEPESINDDVSIDTSKKSSKNKELYIEYINSPYSIEVSKKEFATATGTSLLVTAGIVSSDGKKLTRLKNTDVSAKVIVGDTVTSASKLRDNGSPKNGDTTANDGTYSGGISLANEGVNSVLISLEGMLDGKKIRRSTVISSVVSSVRIVQAKEDIVATYKHVGDVILEEGRYGLPLNVRVAKGTMPDIVDTYAQVWAKDSNGNDSAVGWIGGLVKPVNTGTDEWMVPLSFHSDWLGLAEYHGPLSLREIEVMDVDSGDEILVAARETIVNEIPVEEKQSKASLNRKFMNSESSVAPSGAMRKGVHPETLKLNASNRKGSRTGYDKIVLSLHGLCDGPKSLAHFSEVVQGKGLPYDGTRNGASATRYATDVMVWLNFKPRKLRGIVAHSHGGMAAASLLQNYSYVFEDDGRSRPPNVVSMGTPYHGTSLLEGRLPGWVESRLISLYQYATGCSIPSELYPSRNSSWNNSIGWRARSQISSWYTTHTRPPRFENRDCRDTLSMQIPGSDDGVLAPRDGLGFADGGEYDLHYSGHCHLPGMGQGDQWKHPSFVNYVNNLFYPATESYQPF